VSSPATRPNVVVILPDQLRADFLGSYGGLCVNTESIDRLASEGVRYAAAFSASPVCVPARTALLTGRSALRTGVLHNAHGLRPDHRALGIYTWPELLAEAGYYTAAVGKMHLYPWDWRLGFQYRVVAEDKRWFKIRDDYYWHLRDHGLVKDHAKANPAYEEGLGAFMSPVPWELSVDHFVGNAARAFIEKMTDHDRPFALFVGFPSPHDPYDPVPEALRRVAGEHLPEAIRGNPADAPLVKEKNIETNRLPWCGIDYRGLTPADSKRLRLHYAALVSQIDQEVGAIVDALRARPGVWDNTIVMFTSDHGDYLGDHSMVGKESFFESAIRIPLIVKPAGGCEANASASLVELADVGASLLRLCNVPETSAGDARTLPGLGLPLEPERDALFGALHDGWMVRTAHWKLHKYATGEVLLYDLENDPTELENLATSAGRQSLIAELDSMLTRHVMTCVEAASQDLLISDSDDLWDSDAFGREGWTRPYPYRPRAPAVPAPKPEALP
jgi:arylsulfatase